MSDAHHRTPDAPSQSLQWLRPLIPKRLQPTLRGIRKRWNRSRMKLDEPFYSVYPFTLASLPRQHSLFQLAAEIERNGVSGALVECGVLDGGMSGLMAYATVPSGRPIHMFDSWQGLPDSTDEDKASGKRWAGQALGSRSRVRQCMNILKIDPARLHFHVGWFHETFPAVDIGEIALLHIDCDFFAPTKLCLDTWYPKLVSGGFVQLDDYDEFIGCRTAVDAFLAKHPALRLEYFGMGGRACYLRKP
jgi:O-methyltransferase